MKGKEYRSTYHKVNLEMGLRILPKGIDVLIPLFVRDVVLVLHQPIINTREPGNFEQAHEVAVQGGAVLEFRDVRQDRVVRQILYAARHDDILFGDVDDVFLMWAIDNADRHAVLDDEPFRLSLG